MLPNEILSVKQQRGVKMFLNFVNRKSTKSMSPKYISLIYKIYNSYICVGQTFTNLLSDVSEINISAKNFVNTPPQ